jgi:hypothetical protein
VVTQAQIQFFQKLLEEKDFGQADLGTLAGQFATLNKKSASIWIEKAMQLPKVNEATEEIVAPAF